MKKITVEVTQQDIEQGEGGNPFCCPIALSLKRIDEVGDCSVGLERAWFNSKAHNLPQEAKSFISQFDKWDNRKRQGSAPSPFKFELEVQD